MSKLPFFPSKPSKKLRIINKVSGKTTYDDMEFLPLPAKRFWSFPPGADLITLFSLARSSGSLIVGPTFAGPGESPLIPDEWRWPGMAGNGYKKYCRFSCLWGVHHS